MNERIKELWEASRQWDSSDDGRGGLKIRESAEKFAELIVRECAKFLDENSGYDNSNNAWHPEPEDLLKHFGVKHEPN